MPENDGTTQRRQGFFAQPEFRLYPDSIQVISSCKQRLNLQATMPVRLRFMMKTAPVR
jgi:hypothetical protein